MLGLRALDIVELEPGDIFRSTRAGNTAGLCARKEVALLRRAEVKDGVGGHCAGRELLEVVVAELDGADDLRDDGGRCGDARGGTGGLKSHGRELRVQGSTNGCIMQGNQSAIAHVNELNKGGASNSPHDASKRVATAMSVVYTPATQV